MDWRGTGFLNACKIDTMTQGVRRLREEIVIWIGYDKILVAGAVQHRSAVLRQE